MKKRKEKERELLSGMPETVETALETQKEKTAPASAGEAEREKMEADIALFHELFPEVKGDQIPDSVWAMVEEGESLAAAFALYTVQKQREEEKIQAVNEENEKKAPPRIHNAGGQEEYFSPEAVKAMSRSEIKKNYDAILRSMENWN